MTYEEFYLKYHELDKINQRIKIERHSKMGSDMGSLAKEMLFRIFPNIDKKCIMLGNTKIYMKDEIIRKFDTKLMEWIKFKN